MKAENMDAEIMGIATPTATSTKTPTRTGRRRVIKPAAPAKQPDKETLGRWESEGGPDPDAIVEPQVTDAMRAKVGAMKMAVAKAIDVVRKKKDKVSGGAPNGQ